VNFPAREETRRTNQYLDVNGQYDNLRSRLGFVGSYWKQTTYEAQQQDAKFDDFDPNDPSVETPSRNSLLSESRTRIQLRPSFDYSFSQKIGVEVNALYQTVKLDSEGQDGNSEYDYLSLDGSVVWSLDQRNELATGVYGAQYDGDEGGKVNAKGINLGLRRTWTPTFAGFANVNVEETEVEGATSAEDDKSTNWGMNIGISRTGEISRLRLTAGRTFTPSSGGSRTIVDQVRAQYSRKITERMNFLGALRANRIREQDSIDSDNDRDNATGSLELSWNATRTWSLIGGYTYSWREFKSDSASSHDHVLSVGVRYLGLTPP
jgi:hypothetical protein